MRELEIPEWVARVGAEVRTCTEQLPTNEPYLVEVTELLRLICEREPRFPRVRGDCERVQERRPLRRSNASEPRERSHRGSR